MTGAEGVRLPPECVLACIDVALATFDVATFWHLFAEIHSYLAFPEIGMMMFRLCRPGLEVGSDFVISEIKFDSFSTHNLLAIVESFEDTTELVEVLSVNMLAGLFVLSLSGTESIDVAGRIQGG